MKNELDMIEVNGDSDGEGEVYEWKGKDVLFCSVNKSAHPLLVISLREKKNEKQCIKKICYNLL